MHAACRMALHSPLLSTCSTLCRREKPLPIPNTPLSLKKSHGRLTPLSLKKSHGRLTRATSSGDHDPHLMTEEEREEMRRQIREMLDKVEDPAQETDPTQRKIKMQKLLEEYPLVVEEEDPDWPEDADGWGFNFGQFFDKITIKNVKNEDQDDDGENEIVWQDDNYIKAIRDITAEDWEDAVFKDFNPLVILVHHRYKRPRESEKARIELEKAVKMFWETGLPSPRCVAIDAVIEEELVSALRVSAFPQILFTKAGKILHRDKGVRSGEEW